MKIQRDGRAGTAGRNPHLEGPVGTPGKRTLTEQLPVAPGGPDAGTQPPIQRRLTRGGQDESPAQVEGAAQRGISGAAGPLPYLDAIQRSFGKHDVSHVQAHTDGAAAEGAAGMGARAFATGDHVAFGGAPDLHTAAHEAAHVVQQRAGVHLKGGVGEAGDAYERNADEVADLVTQGRSSEAALDRMAGGASRGVQRVVTKNDKSYLSPTELELALEEHDLSFAERQKVFALDQERREYTVDQAVAIATGRQPPAQHESNRNAPLIEPLPSVEIQPPPSKATAMHGICMGTDKVTAEQVFQGIQIGYRVFDLAHRYKTQGEVGNGIKLAIEQGIVQRRDLTLIYKLDPVAEDVEAHVQQIVLQALGDLGVDYLDVAMLHDVPRQSGVLQANLRALRMLLSSSVIREIGLSNVEDPKLLGELHEDPEMPKISMVQNEMNPLVPDDLVIEACHHFKIIYLGYSPIGGQLSKDQLLSDPALLEVAGNNKLSVAQLLLKWAMARGVIPITKSSRVEGMKENLATRNGEKLDGQTMSSIALAAKELAIRLQSQQQGGLELHHESLDTNVNEPTGPEVDEISQLKVALQTLALATGAGAINDALGIVQVALGGEQVMKFRKIMTRAKSPFVGYADKLLAPGDLGTCDIPKIALAALQSIQD